VPPVPDAADRLRQLSRQLVAAADDLGADASRAELDNVVAELRVLIVRRFGRKPRAARGGGARHAILAHLLANVDQWLDGEELAAVSGIQAWARRVRELRVEHGYDIVERDDRYRLRRAEPDATTAERWRAMYAIRRSSGSGRDRVLAFLRAYVGQVVTRDDVDYVARIKEGTRRVRELRDYAGWPIASHIDDPGLQPRQYRLVSDNEDDRRDPRQRRYPEDLRARVFRRDRFTCRRCGRDRAAAEAAGDSRFYLEVHHMRAVAEQLDALPEDELNDESNLVTYCHACHVAETADFQRRRRRERRGD
jgi:5-methylcytosine-specific restriction endonuclease McrA